MLGDARIIELKKHGIIYSQIAAAQAGLKLLNLSQGTQVALVELVLGAPVALHQGGTNKNLTCSGGIYPGILHWTVGINRQSVQCALRIRYGGTPACRPVRLGILLFQQVPAHFFNPLRLNRGVCACPQPGSLHKLGREHPVRVLFEKPGTWEDSEFCTACPQIFARTTRGFAVGFLTLLFSAHMREQTRKQTLMNLNLTPRSVNIASVRHADIRGAPHLTQLGEKILPLTNTQKVNKLAVAHFSQLRRGKLSLALINVLPQQQERRKIRFIVRETGMHLIGGATHLSRAFARILNRQSSGKNHHLFSTVTARTLNNHACQARIDRERTHCTPRSGQRRGSTMMLPPFIRARRFFRKRPKLTQ